MPRFFHLLLFELLVLWHRAILCVSTEKLASVPSSPVLGPKMAREAAGRVGAISLALLEKRMLPGPGENQGHLQSLADRPSSRHEAGAGTQTSATSPELSWRHLPNDVQLTIARRGYLSRIVESHWRANQDLLLGLQWPSGTHLWTCLFTDPREDPRRDLSRPLRSHPWDAEGLAAAKFRDKSAKQYHVIEEHIRPSLRTGGPGPLTAVLNPYPVIEQTAERAVRDVLLEYTRHPDPGLKEFARILNERLRQPLMVPRDARVQTSIAEARRGIRSFDLETAHGELQHYMHLLENEVEVKTKNAIYDATQAAIQAEKARQLTAGPRQRPHIFWTVRARAGAWAARVDARPAVEIRSLWAKSQRWAARQRWVRRGAKMSVPPEHDGEKAAMGIAQEYAMGVWGDVCHAQGLRQNVDRDGLPNPVIDDALSLHHGFYIYPRPVPVPRGLRRKPGRRAKSPP